MFFVNVDEIPRRKEAGVIKQAIDCAELVDTAIDEGGRFGPIGDVRLDCNSRSTISSYFVNDLLGRTLVDVVDDYRRTLESGK
jgi:hypothetical protein